MCNCATGSTGNPRLHDRPHDGLRHHLATRQCTPDKLVPRTSILLERTKQQAYTTAFKKFVADQYAEQAESMQPSSITGCANAASTMHNTTVQILHTGAARVFGESTMVAGISKAWLDDSVNDTHNPEVLAKVRARLQAVIAHKLAFTSKKATAADACGERIS